MAMAHHTYCVGADSADDLASRAREIGVQHRMAQVRPGYLRGAGMLMSTRLQIAALKGLYDDEEEEPAMPYYLAGTSDGDYEIGRFARPRRTPSWLDEALAERRMSTRLSSLGVEEAGGEAVEGKGGFTLTEAFLASVKSCVGPAVLYMPKGFQEAGLSFGLGMLLLSYALFGYGAMRLLETWRAHRKSYSGLMGAAFGKTGVALVRVTIVLQQCGICMTYFVFVATNLREVAVALAPAHVEAPSLAVLCLAQVAVYAPLACVRDLQMFAHTNLLANALILYSLFVLVCFGFERVAVNPEKAAGRLEFFNPSQFYLFVGTSAFVYEGSAALVVPLQEAVREDLQHKFAPLYLKTAGGIIATYIVFGLVNWGAYGNDTQTVLTVNLPEGAWKISVQIAYLTAVVFTFPLQLFPAISILKSAVHKLHSLLRKCRRPTQFASPSSAPPGYAAVASDTTQHRSAPPPDAAVAAVAAQKSYDRIQGNLARGILVLALAAASVLEVHDLDRLVALIGGLLGIPLAFVYPVAIHAKLVPDQPFRRRAVSTICIVVGTVLGLACTAVTIATW